MTRIPRRLIRLVVYFSPALCPSASHLFCSFGAALGALWTRAVSGSWASLCCLGVDIFGHVDIIVQQHLLLHPTRGSRGGLSVARLTQLLQASPAAAPAAPAVSLQASARLGAAAAAAGRQEGWKCVGVGGGGAGGGCDEYGEVDVIQLCTTNVFRETNQCIIFHMHNECPGPWIVRSYFYRSLLQHSARFSQMTLHLFSHSY